jgi:uncharacterized protein YjbJ (UPF0337 family)
MSDLKSGALLLSRAPASMRQLYQMIWRINMNKDVFEGKWKQIRGEAKSWWGKLTDDDLDRVAGKVDVFAGLLQEKYGYSHQRAVNEIDSRMTKLEASLKDKVHPTPVK